MSKWLSKWLFALLFSFLSLSARAGADGVLVFAINEGATYRISAVDTRAKYEAVADDLSKLLHRRVQVEPVTDYASLSAGLAEKRYDLAYVHPAHVSIRAIRSGNYHLVALTKGYTDYRTTFFVASGSPLRGIGDLKGKKISAPDQDSITSWMIRATLRDAIGGNSANDITYTRYQDAIPFMVEQGLADAGGSSSGGVVKAWSEKGGKLLGTSKAVPIKHLLAASSLPADQFKLVQDYFLNLEGGDVGRSRLEKLQLTGFTGFDESLLVGIGKWLGV